MSVRNSLAAGAALTLSAALLSIPTATSAWSATPPVRFNKAYYDSPGADTGTNTSVNREWVRIKNYSSVKKYLTGWTVRDKQSHVYTFGKFALVPGASVTLYTGKGTNSSTKRYWGLSYYVWNNTGDTAYLKTSSGTTVDTCSWSSVGVGYKTC